MNKVDRILVVGLGSIGKRHLQVLRDHWPDIYISVLRSSTGNDVPEEKLADKIVYTIEEAIDTKVQSAIIAIPAPYHLYAAKKFIEHGVHILVEKPLTESLASARELGSDLSKSTTVGLVGYCLRYDPNATKFKQLLEQKSIGDVLQVSIECGSYLPDWRPGQNYKKNVSSVKSLGGGVLLELSHEFDYARWFFGEIETVFAQYNNSSTLGIDVEDQADLLLTTKAGFPISVHIDFNTRYTRRYCTARGTKGDLIWDAVNNQIILNIVGKAPIVETENHDRNYIYVEQIRHFWDCIENNTTPNVSFTDGIKVLQIVDAARISNDLGTRVTIE
ncbi:MAG: Gfo/Idh/MocA family oxidoreductase [SAR324 cluster bacterium]|nr:Gfo/Idh/MocA family oxidoreductase [SAR324 cluster bacterium]